MTDSRAAVGFDRLPWLADEPERTARAARNDLAGWAVAGFLLVAGASYWFGQQSVNELSRPSATRSVPQSTTVALPEPQPVQPQVRPDRVPDVEPLPAPSISVARPAVERYVPPKRTASRPAKAAETPSESAKD